MQKIAVTIPAHDESESIALVVCSVKAYVEADIIVVDDASSDNTAAIARASGAIVLKHVVNMGAWKATQTAMRYCFKHGYDRVVAMDADGQHRAADIPLLLEKLQQGNDLVVGACTKRGSRGRHIAWRTFKFLAKLPVDDLTSGFRGYSRKSIQILSSRQATLFEYQDVGVLLMLRNAKAKICEVQVEMKQREHGISRIFKSWTAVAKYLIYTLVLSLTKAIPVFSKKYNHQLLNGNHSE